MAQYTPSASNKMTRTNLQFRLQLLLLLLMLMLMLQLGPFLPAIAALPQPQPQPQPQEEFLFDEAQLQQAPSSPAFNVPSDLSAGLNLLPVTNLITAAANSEPPAPVQFVRIAMNSGL